MSLRVALLVPHVFMQDELLKSTIFSPGTIALDLAKGLSDLGHQVTIFSPGSIKESLGSSNSNVRNITGDWSLIQKELDSRSYDIHTLMQKHPLTYITLARQVQSELIAKAYQMANEDKFDVVHVWINEEDLSLNFVKLCKKPVVFTHHDPFNLLTKYRTSMWKYRDLNWVSVSYAQRRTMTTSPQPSPGKPGEGGPQLVGVGEEVNWIANIYHGMKPLCTAEEIKPQPERKYFAFLGRIIEAKGVHLAIDAVQKYNLGRVKPTPLLIAGKHYSSTNKASYWETKIKPTLDDTIIKYVGYVDGEGGKKEFLKNAKALIVPSIFDEPFGMIMIEALSCGTPIIGLNNGAIPEIIEDGVNGFVAETKYIKHKPVSVGKRPCLKAGKHAFSLPKEINKEKTVDSLVAALEKVSNINNQKCYEDFKNRFAVERMAKEYLDVYMKLKPNGEK